MHVVLDGYSLTDVDPYHLHSLSNDAYQIVGITNYLGHSSKVGTRAQLDAFWDAGFQIAMNWELSGGEWMQGYARGLTDGRDARNQVRSYGLMDDVPIIQSTDTSVNNLTLLASYQRGFNDGAGNGHPQGAYGPGFAVEYLYNLGLVYLPWQWKDGRTPTVAHAVMRQTYLQPWSVNTVGCPYDLNFVIASNWGQTPLVVDPLPLPVPEDDNMPGFTLVRHNGGAVYRIDKGETQKHVVQDLQAIACDFDIMRLSGDANPHIVDLIDDASHDWNLWLASIPTVTT